VEWGIKRGLPVDAFAPRLSFFFNSHNEFFEEICKLRAARRIWAHAMRERFGAKNERSWLMRTHVQTAGCSLTEQQPLNNVVRVAIQALAAVLGSCQSLHTNSYDEALALPSEEAVQLALRTQQIIAYESGVADTVDPMGGSHYLEWLTNRIEEGIQKYIATIDQMGGALEAIKRGYIQREIRRSAYNHQRAVDAGEQVVVGVNKYTSDEPLDLELLEIDESIAKKQLQRLKQLKSGRNNKEVRQILDKVRRTASSQENIMPVLIEAVRLYATVGEISGALRDIFGEYKEPSVL